MANLFSHSKGEGPLTTHGRRQYICRKCHVTFNHYKGVKSFGNGVGLCKEHNPAVG